MVEPNSKIECVADKGLFLRFIFPVIVAVFFMYGVFFMFAEDAHTKNYDNTVFNNKIDEIPVNHLQDTTNTIDNVRLEAEIILDNAIRTSRQ